MKTHASRCLSAFLLLASSSLMPAQTPTLPFDAPVVLGDSQTRFRASLDYDADGHVDFVSVWFPSDSLMLVKGYRGDGAGNLLPDWSVTHPIPPLAPNNEPPAPIAVGDFNGDGHEDFVLAVQDIVGYWLSNGAGAVPYVTWVWQESALIDQVLTADFDGNGLSDVLLQQGSQVRIYLTADLGTAAGPRVVRDVRRERLRDPRIHPRSRRRRHSRRGPAREHLSDSAAPPAPRGRRRA